MGKQSKRKGGKRRGGGSGGQGRHDPTGTAATAAAIISSSSSASDPPASAASAQVVKKIRHGDPRVRHAALAALGCTLYEPSMLASQSSSSKKKKKKKSGAEGETPSSSDPSLLRALAERLLDDDSPCAIAAAGCLSNYASFGLTDSGSADDNERSAEDEQRDSVACEVLAPILLERIRRSSEGLRELGDVLRKYEVAIVAAAVAAKDAIGADGNAVVTAPTAKGKKGKKGKKSASSSSPLTLDKKLVKSQGERWVLLALSVQTLAALIENLPRALERMGGFEAGPFASLVGVLTLSGSFLELPATPTPAPTPPSNGDDHGDEGRSSAAIISNDDANETKKSVLSAATGAARALHSAMDDNPSLVRAVSSAAAVLLSLGELRNAARNEGLPPAARLHACGAVLAVRRVLVEDDDSNDKNGDSTATATSSNPTLAFLQETATETIVPLLRDALVPNVDRARASVRRMVELGDELRLAEKDEEMESEITRSVAKRREPARQIAKRLKKRKDVMKAGEERHRAAGKEGEGGAMETDEAAAGAAEEEDSGAEDDVAEDAVAGMEAAFMEDDAKTEEEQKATDKEDELEREVASWKELTGAHKLALEIVANLCAGKDDDADGPTAGGNGMEEDEQMWDSDDEAAFMDGLSSSPGDGNASASTSSHPLDLALLGTATSAGVLPNGVVSILGTLADLYASIVVGEGDGNENSGGCPQLVAEDLDELLSTCSACLVNAVTCDALFVTGATNTTTEAIWKEFVSIASRHRSISTIEGAVAASTAVTAAVASAMLAALRHRSEARTFVDATGLDLLLSLLAWEGANTSNGKTGGGDGKMDENATPPSHPLASDIRRDAASMLGLLCSEPHSDDVDARVCSALVSALRRPENASKAEVTSEILNVLMDMYGDDDDGAAFESMDVIGHFRRCLAAFKQRIRREVAEARGGGGGGIEGEAEVWNETALNAARFIKYKESSRRG